MKFFSLRTMAAVSFLGASLAALHAPPAEAVVQEIRAEFVPDPANPLVNKFVNKTPQSGVCPERMAALCERLGIFSLRIDGLRFESSQPIPADHTDPRQGATFGVPSSWRDVEVVHTTTGERETVQMRVAGIGGYWWLERPPGVSAWARPGSTWNSQWSIAPAPCTSTGLGLGYVNGSFFFWLVPEGAGACSRTPAMDIPWFRYTSVEYVYELRTPNPLRMSTGEYRGSLTYTAGPGMDFDMGDVMFPNDNTITLNFILDVKHSLKVEIPPGGHHVELVPQGGWQAWLQRSRRPERLFRDQTFIISASSRFKMQLECQYFDPDSSNTCALNDPVSGHTVPLNVAVSLPGGMTDALGQSVTRRPLLLDGAGTELFAPGHYIDRKPGTLHFDIGREAVEEMLTGDGKTYTGNVTVIWDSQVF